MKQVIDRRKVSMPLEEYTSGGKYDVREFFELKGYLHFFTTIQGDYAEMEFCKVEERGEA